MTKPSLDAGDNAAAERNPDGDRYERESQATDTSTFAARNKARAASAKRIAAASNKRVTPEQTKAK